MPIVSLDEMKKQAEDQGKTPLRDGMMMKDLTGHDEQMAATMADTAAAGKGAWRAAANVGMDWELAAPLAPKDGFYNERYRCKTMASFDMGDPDEFEKLFCGDEEEPPGERLTLACKGIDDHHCADIKRYLVDPRCLCKSLWLNDNKIRHDGAKLLSEALEENRTLTALYLNHNNIGDLGLYYLLEKLKKNTTLLKLEVGACSIGELEEGEKNNAASMVMDALKANSTIEHIGLFGNHDNMEDDLPKIYKTLEPRRDEREKKLSQGAR